MWFPWAYYARATGKPIESDGDPGDHTRQSNLVA